MSSTIVIDGYNLIRQSDELIALEAISLQEGRNGLIKLLAEYKKVKGHSITVVFDGWESDNIGSSKYRERGIDIIYSGKGEKADELIKRMADNLRDKIIVVTSDREIATHAMKKGSVVIPSSEFEMKVRMVSGFDEFGFDDDEEDEPRMGTKKKGPARRRSKEDRKKLASLKKL